MPGHFNHEGKMPKMPRHFQNARAFQAFPTMEMLSSLKMPGHFKMPSMPEVPGKLLPPLEMTLENARAFCKMPGHFGHFA